MANKLIVTRLMDNEDEDELQHWGILGMKWGVRRANYKTKRLTKKVQKVVNRFDKGKAPEVGPISRKVRRHKYKVSKGIGKAKRFLAKNQKADAKAVINRFNRDPAKKLKVEQYLKDMEVNIAPLAELRVQLIDIRI